MNYRTIGLSVTLLLLVVVVAGASTLSDLSHDMAAIAKQAGPSAVQIEVERDFIWMVTGPSGDIAKRPDMAFKSVGSGFVIDPNGLVLTTMDVVANAKRIKVVFPDGSTAEAKLLGSDTITDSAVIKVEKAGLKAAALGDSDSIAPGMLVVTVNSQAGMANSVSLGVVAATDRETGMVPGFVMQISGTVGPGSSGGVVLDTEGRVVGMTFAMFSPTSQVAPFNLPNIFMMPSGKSKGATDIFQFPEGALNAFRGMQPGTDRYETPTDADQAQRALEATRDMVANMVDVSRTSGSSGFAMPINRVKAILEQLKSGKPIERGMLGIGLTPEGEGIVVASVRGPAETAGVKIGDVLVSVDGHRFAKRPEVVTYIMGLKSGSKVDLVVRREGKELRFAVTTVARTEKTVDLPDTPARNVAPKSIISQSNVSLSLNDAGIAEVAKALSEASGKNVVVVNPESIKGKVTVHLKSVTLESALSFVCDALKCKYTKAAQGYVIQALK